jgi:ribosomal protein S18 acetylase RimI-like enzyme
MPRHTVRPLQPGDYAHLSALEVEVFGAVGEEVLCPHYLRLCCEFFAGSCFIGFVDDRPAAYLLSFVRERSCYCTTLAVHPDYQRTRITLLLLREFVRGIAHQVDRCWFTVKHDNAAARSLHKMLGAREVEVRRDYYGPGEDRIISTIDRDAFEQLRDKYERLGFVDKRPPVEVAA